MHLITINEKIVVKMLWILTIFINIIFIENIIYIYIYLNINNKKNRQGFC